MDKLHNIHPGEILRRILPPMGLTQNRPGVCYRCTATAPATRIIEWSTGEVQAGIREQVDCFRLLSPHDPERFARATPAKRPLRRRSGCCLNHEGKTVAGRRSACKGCPGGVAFARDIRDRCGWWGCCCAGRPFRR